MEMVGGSEYFGRQIGQGVRQNGGLPFYIVFVLEILYDAA